MLAVLAFLYCVIIPWIGSAVVDSVAGVGIGVGAWPGTLVGWALGGCDEAPLGAPLGALLGLWVGAILVALGDDDADVFLFSFLFLFSFSTPIQSITLILLNKCALDAQYHVILIQINYNEYNSSNSSTINEFF